MVLMNEIDKRTNILLEQLEVSKAGLFDTLGNETKLNLIPVPVERIQTVGAIVPFLIFSNIWSFSADFYVESMAEKDLG